MTSLGEAIRTPSVWQELSTLAREQGSREAYLRTLLGLWCAEHGATAAAIYRKEDSEFRLEAAGESGEPWPESLCGDPPAGVFALSFPGGHLFYRVDRGPLAESDCAGPLTQLVMAELSNRWLRRTVKEQRFQASFRGVEMEALYDVGLAIASALDSDELSEEILWRAVSLIDARRGALYLKEEDRFVLDSTFGGDALDSFDSVSDGGGEIVEPENLLPGAEHLMTWPISIDDSPRGLLVVADKESRTGVGPFGDGDRRTLSLFANQAAIALENARLHRQELEKQRLDREMELAAEIQQRFLPKSLPAVAGFELTGWNRSAQQVGGDYYDLMALEDGRLRLVLGDVSGKGMPAALLVATLHSTLRLLLGQKELESALVEKINRHIDESSAANKFITLMVGDLDPMTGRLTYFNAGHNPPLLLRRAGGLEELAPGGPPVGLLPRGAYTEGTVDLEKGDLLCIFSDGITEAADGDDEEFGPERLAECLAVHRDRPLPEIVEEIDKATGAFALGQPQGDDQTVVLLRRATSNSG